MKNCAFTERRIDYEVAADRSPEEARRAARRSMASSNNARRSVAICAT
jgi:hypothetical protein